MSEKYEVEVRDGNGSKIETINVVLRGESIGNFNPLFCTYKKRKRCLVESDEPHLDDPMRCVVADHIGKLFIRPRGADGKVVTTWVDAR